MADDDADLGFGDEPGDMDADFGDDIVDGDEVCARRARAAAATTDSQSKW
jgi:hypothetical protein